MLADDAGEHFKEHHARRWMEQLVEASGVAWRGTHVGAIATHLRHEDLQTASRSIDRRGASSRALDALER